MADVTLSAAVRSSLLSLQDTSKLVKQTQGRLSTGLRVASAIDDPVAFFQAKGLNDRAKDLNQKKDGIDQGISGVTAALDAVQSVENVVQQLKGLANSLKSATGSQFTDLLGQFNSLRTQIGSLVADASYQGTNLVNNTAQTLSVEFSDKTASLLTVTAARLDETGLAIGAVSNYTNNSSTFMINYSANASKSLTAGSSLAFTYQGADVTFSTGAYVSLSYGTGSVALNVASGTLALTQGTVYSATIANTLTGAGVTWVAGENLTGKLSVNFSAATAQSFAASTAGITFTYQGVDTTLTTANDGDTINYGGTTLTVELATGASIAITNGTTFVAETLITGTTASVGAIGVISTAVGVGTAAAIQTAVSTDGNNLTYGKNSALSTDGQFTTWVSEGDSKQLNAAIAQLDAGLGKLRSQASSLGSNVALLQTRLDFTSQYVNTLEQGASKLTLADINQEGANLLALQTRQQLGITSLSFAGQAEQAILGLF